MEHLDGVFDQFARVAKRLAHPARLHLLDLLAQGSAPSSRWPQRRV